VARVTTMLGMFNGAISFTRTLCGETWIYERDHPVVRTSMFSRSFGSIGLHPDVCIPNWSLPVILAIFIVTLTVLFEFMLVSIATDCTFKRYQVLRFYFSRKPAELGKISAWEVFHKIDVDDNGVLSLDEFKTWYMASVQDNGDLSVKL